jgi:SpoVK/Ycf46/Vps4 family AAA+-type ATPase
MLPNDMFFPSLVQSFAHYNYRSDFAETVYGKHNCDWIFDVDEMKWWVEGRNTPVRILWLTGYPGIGKSTLASHIVEKYLTRIDQVRRQSTSVIYSWCH